MLSEPISAGQSRQSQRDYVPTPGCGENSAAVAEYVCEHPGCIAAEVSRATGLNASAVGPLLRSARSAGLIRRDDDKRWWPASYEDDVDVIKRQRDASVEFDEVAQCLSALKSRVGVLPVRPVLEHGERRVYSARCLAQWLEDLGTDALLVSDLRALADFSEQCHEG